MNSVISRGGRLLPAAFFLVALAASACTFATPAAAQAAPDINDLPAGPGREEVFYNCYTCHSFRIIKQQRLPEAVWDELMDWMVEKHGMPPLNPEDRKAVVSYLTKNFGPQVPR